MERFKTLQEWLDLAVKYQCDLHDILIKREAFTSGKTAQEIIEKMHKSLEAMKKSIQDGLNRKEPTMGGLACQEAGKLLSAMDQGKIPSDRINRTAYKALAVSELNAGMGRIVAAPTAGSCGILPAVLSTVLEEKELTDEQGVNALFIAAGIGMVIAEQATIAGAEGGCQAECGAAASMAAGAAVYLYGGSPEQIMDAAALALKNTLGLVCDPVAGLVEVPCIKRNAFLAVHALVAADLAFAGISSVIPADEVIQAMAEIAREMSIKYKETALGGLAVTPTGNKIMERIRTTMTE